MKPQLLQKFINTDTPDLTLGPVISIKLNHFISPISFEIAYQLRRRILDEIITRNLRDVRNAFLQISISIEGYEIVNNEVKENKFVFNYTITFKPYLFPYSEDDLDSLLFDFLNSFYLNHGYVLCHRDKVVCNIKIHPSLNSAMTVTKSPHFFYFYAYIDTISSEISSIVNQQIQEKIKKGKYSLSPDLSFEINFKITGLQTVDNSHEIFSSLKSFLYKPFSHPQLINKLDFLIEEILKTYSWDNPMSTYFITESDITVKQVICKD